MMSAKECQALADALKAWRVILIARWRHQGLKMSTRIDRVRRLRFRHALVVLS